MDVQSSKRIAELDGLRGIACLMVFLWHYFGVIDRSFGPIAAVCQALGLSTNSAVGGNSDANAALSALTVLAPSGVDLFFVLSGFLISGILFDNSESPNYFRTFYIRRVCRIFPVYYLTLVSCILALPLVKLIPAMNLWLMRDLMPFWSYATFSQNFFMAGDATTNGGGRWLAMTWSVAVEEQFYLLLPFVVRFASRATVRDLAVISILAAGVLRIGAKSAGIWYYPLLPCRIDCMAVGVLLAYALRQPGAWTWLRENRLRVYGGMALCLIGFAFFHDHMLGYTWIALFFGCVLLLVVVHPETRLGWVCRWRGLQWLGLVSYGVYMYHQAVNGLLHAMILESEPAIRNWESLIVTLASTLVTLVLAATSYHFVERHLLRLGRKACWRPAAQAAQPPSLAKAA